MMKCGLYCRQTKYLSGLALEHVIPQFLGGAYAPEGLRVGMLYVNGATTTLAGNGADAIMQTNAGALLS